MITLSELDFSMNICSDVEVSNAHKLSPTALEVDVELKIMYSKQRKIYVLLLHAM